MVPWTHDQLALEPTLAQGAARVIADTADGSELARLIAQGDALATNTKLLQRQAGQLLRSPEIVPIRTLVHPSNSDTEPRILGDGQRWYDRAITPA